MSKLTDLLHELETEITEKLEAVGQDVEELLPEVIYSHIAAHAAVKTVSPRAPTVQPDGGVGGGPPTGKQ